MIDDFDFYEAVFSQPDAVELTQADNDTIDNWVRYKHIVPHRIGKRRMFSFLQLLLIDLTWTLTRTFKTELDVATHIAFEAAKGYGDTVHADRAEILAGADWGAVVSDRGDATFSLTRDASTKLLRPTDRADLGADDVMIVVPVRLIGRRLLAAMAVWSESAA
jgi:hypothetical protein